MPNVKFVGEIKLDRPLSIKERDEFAFFTIDGTRLTCPTQNFKYNKINDWVVFFNIKLEKLKLRGIKPNGRIDLIGIYEDTEINIGYVEINEGYVDEKIDDVAAIVHNLTRTIKELQQDNKRLEDDNARLKLEICYMPGGKGALEAKEHFDSLMQ